VASLLTRGWKIYYLALHLVFFRAPVLRVFSDNHLLVISSHELNTNPSGIPNDTQNAAPLIRNVGLSTCHPWNYEHLFSNPQVLFFSFERNLDVSSLNVLPLLDPQKRSFSNFCMDLRDFSEQVAESFLGSLLIQDSAYVSSSLLTMIPHFLV
jgi:hypothetical protein